MTGDPSSILITGASSGIGRALAIRYARNGVRLFLVGRNSARLDEAALACRALGAEVETALVDVREREALAQCLEAADRVRPFDLVIANAALTTGTPGPGEIEPSDESLSVFEINVIGLINTVHPIIPLMVGRGRGQIVLVSSIAGLIALPDSPSYSASKSAVVAYGQALRGALRPHGVKVNVVCPGFVATPMSARVSGWKPFEITAERAAAIIGARVARNDPMIAFPRSLAFVARVGSLLPEPLRRLFLLAFKFEVAPSAREPN